MTEVVNEEENDDLDSDEEDHFQRAYDIFRAEQDEQLEESGLVSDDVESYEEYNSDYFSVDYDEEIDNFNRLDTNLGAGLESYVTGGFGQVSDCPLEEDLTDGVIPSTDAGEQAYIIQESGCNKSDMVNGHVILNHACTLLSREDRDIKGYSVQKNFIQRIASTTSGDCIPLLYPEAMICSLLYSIFLILRIAHFLALSQQVFSLGTFFLMVLRNHFYIIEHESHPFHLQLRPTIVTFHSVGHNGKLGS